MHAEPREFTGQAYAKAPVVMSSARASRSAALISTDIKESGLWLWQGEVPPSPSLPQPKSRYQKILRRIMPVARWTGWIALPAGFALAFLAVSMIPRSDKSVSANTPVSAHRPAAARTPAEPKEAQLDQVQLPSPPAAKIATQGPEPPLAKGRAERKLSRSARKTHAHRAHVRRGQLLFPMPGVLTPPPMTWQGGDY